MDLTREQKRLVTDSFERMRETAIPIAVLFYGKLFELDPGARMLFHNDLRLQGQKLMETLSSLVEALDRFEQIQGKLAQLGRRHAEFGVKPHQYDTLKTALLWAMAQALGPDFGPDTRAAWAVVIESVNHVMTSRAAV